MRYVPRHRHYRPCTQKEIVRDVICERGIEITILIHPAEPETQFCPGRPPEGEVLSAIWCDTKKELTEDEIAPYAWGWQNRGLDKAEQEWRLARDRAEAGE
jgi:hypothetical protein